MVLKFDTYRFQRSTRMMMGIPLPILLSPRMLRITLTQRFGKRIRSIIRIITFWYNKGEGLRLEKAWVFFCANGSNKSNKKQPLSFGNPQKRLRIIIQNIFPDIYRETWISTWLVKQKGVKNRLYVKNRSG